MNVEEMNLLVLEKYSALLSRCPTLINAQDVQDVAACGVKQDEAMLMLLAAACDLADDRSIIERYFKPSLKRLDAQALRCNPYWTTIRFPEAKLDIWEMTHLSYAPYELFVRDDLLFLPDGREIPRLGYFDEAVRYPAVLQDGHVWMTVTPNEIATMEKPLARAHGHAVTMGLGLGYYAFCASEKPEVDTLTIVERDESVIALFKAHILPQFPHKEKVRIVQGDAFAYAAEELTQTDADHVFIDLWHDVSDGAEMYLRMKAIQMRRFHGSTSFDYWIEPSICSFLNGISKED